MSIEDHLKIIENAGAIITLLRSDDEWARNQGMRLSKGLTQRELAAAITQSGAALHAEFSRGLRKESA